MIEQKDKLSLKSIGYKFRAISWSNKWYMLGKNGQTITKICANYKNGAINHAFFTWLCRFLGSHHVSSKRQYPHKP